MVRLPADPPKQGYPLGRAGKGFPDLPYFGERTEGGNSRATGCRAGVAQHERANGLEFQSSESITVHYRKYLPLLHLRA